MTERSLESCEDWKSIVGGGRGIRCGGVEELGVKEEEEEEKEELGWRRRGGLCIRRSLAFLVSDFVSTSGVESRGLCWLGEMSRVLWGTLPLSHTHARARARTQNLKRERVSSISSGIHPLSSL